MVRGYKKWYTKSQMTHFMEIILIVKRYGGLDSELT